MDPDREERLVRVAAARVLLEGNLTLPEGARGIVLFAHGSGSSRFSPRNRYVAQLLNQEKLATLLVDLLSPEEEAVDLQTAQLRFNIGLLAERLVVVTDWLVSAAGHATAPDRIFRRQHRRCCRAGGGSRASQDCARGRLARRAPRSGRTGARACRGANSADSRGNDPLVIELSRAALAQLRCEKRLVIVLGATHLFEEPGALDEVARLAREWFERHLAWEETPATRSRHERGGETS